MKIVSTLTAMFITATLFAHSGELTVAGTAKMMVNADEMVISTGISVDDADANTLQKGMQEKMAAALKYLKAQKGVKSVETDVIRIYNRGPLQKRGIQAQFQGRQSVTIVLTDFELYDQLMVKLFELGFNNINNAHFRLSNMAVEKQKVQLMAIKAAKEKASRFADELGVELEPVLSFAEQSAYTPTVRQANAVQYEAVRVEGDQGSSIQASKVTIEMTVIVSFGIKSEDE